MKLLRGSDIAAFMQERQAHQVRSLRQAHHIELTLQVAKDDPAKAVYQEYADDIGVAVEYADSVRAPANDPPQATALLWLCAGYNIELRGKQIAVVGDGALLEGIADILKKSGNSVVRALPTSDKLASQLMSSEVVVVPGTAPVVSSAMLRPGTIVIELEPGGVAQDVYERDDITMTPKDEGLLPLTAAATIDSLIRGAQPKA